MTFDETLDALAASHAPAGLTGLDAAVFARIDAEARSMRSARLGALAIVGAATLAGVAGAAIPSSRPAATPALIATPLAPSVLLGGGE
jgi:hypothetical protein